MFHVVSPLCPDVSQRINMRQSRVYGNVNALVTVWYTCSRGDISRDLHTPSVYRASRCVIVGISIARYLPFHLGGRTRGLNSAFLSRRPLFTRRSSKVYYVPIREVRVRGDCTTCPPIDLTRRKILVAGRALSTPGGERSRAAFKSIKLSNAP